jgi:tRNA dimethylallyltransferase
MTSSSKTPLIVIVGATASGKSSLAVELAHTFNGYIISADSRQIYRGMDIATAKISPSEMHGIPHEMIDIANPNEEYPLTKYQEDVYRIIRTKHHPRIPFLVGGTGLYINAITFGYQIPHIKPNLKQRQKLEQQSPEELLRIITSIDPSAITPTDIKNKRRLIRTIEVLTHNQTGPQPAPKRQPPDWLRILKIGLDIPREQLYANINTRVDHMFEQGIIEEARTLLDTYDTNLPSMSGIGYLHIQDYLNKKISLDTCKQLIKQDTRKYAKRQLTWFRKDKTITWLSSKEEITRAITTFLNTNQ